MSAKLAAYVSLLVMFVLGVFIYISSNQMTGISQLNNLGPGFFPKILAVLLMVLCVISFIQTLLKKEDKKIVIGNGKMVVATVLITATYFLVWYYHGYFYIVTFIYLSVLINLYHVKSDKKLTIKAVGLNTLISFVMILVIYVIFDLVLPFPIKF